MFVIKIKQIKVLNAELNFFLSYYSKSSTVLDLRGTKRISTKPLTSGISKTHGRNSIYKQISTNTVVHATAN